MSTVYMNINSYQRYGLTWEIKFDTIDPYATTSLPGLKAVLLQAKASAKITFLNQDNKLAQ